jgi:Protein of unknown function (DUF3047)
MSISGITPPECTAAVDKGFKAEAWMVRRARHLLIGSLALPATVGLIGWHFWDSPGEVLKPGGGPVVTVMDFGQSFPLDPLPSGWRHRKFWTRSPMTMSFAVKDGVPSMRFETHDSASMLARSVDIELASYPMLAWRWYIELPIHSPLDERTREGDDHPARLFLRFLTDRGEKRAMEVIWGNRLRPGDYKYIGGFPHFVADAGDDHVGRWLDEKIDLARVYATIWKDAAPTHLIDIAVFCDSDDTHTASVSYFAYVRLERR